MNLKIDTIKNEDFKSLILKQKIVEIYGFKCLAVGYFKKDKIWDAILRSVYSFVFDKEFTGKSLSKNIDPNFYYKFYDKAKKCGCKKCDIFLVLDTPCGIWEKIKGQLIILTNDNFVIIDKKDIYFTNFEEDENKIFTKMVNTSLEN